MHSKNSSTHQTHMTSFWMTARTIHKLLILCLVVAVVPLALYVRVNSKSAAPAVTVQAAGRGKPFFKFRDGQQTKVSYRGEGNATQVLQSGQAQPRALASIILGGDAVPDLVAGYSANGTGVVTVQHGNPEAFAPKDESVYARIVQGYNPESLLPVADSYLVPQSVDFLQVGDFNYDGRKDVLTAARAGDLFLLAGDGRDRLAEAAQIPLPGRVTAIAGGDFRVVDGWTDLAVGVETPSGPAVLIFDGTEALTGDAFTIPLKAPATAMQFADLDHDPFQDLAVAAGDEVIIVHGWSRRRPVDPQSRLQHVSLGSNALDLAVGFFVWNRQANNQIAALSDDGVINILDAGSDTRPYTPEEAALFHRSRIHKTSESVDPESLAGWQPADAQSWTSLRQLAANPSLAVEAMSQKVLLPAKMSFQETQELLMLDGSQRQLNIVRQDISKDGLQAQSVSGAGDLATTSLDMTEAPAAFEAFPQKVNGGRSLFVLQKGSLSPKEVPNEPAATPIVDRTDDPAVGGASTADDCTGALNDCSLRGAVQVANANPGSTITVPVGTYTLTINGTASTGCDGNSVGDLGINASTTITGAGSGTTIIRQHGTNVANVGDRVICLNEFLTNSITYTISGVTIIGGRDSSTWTAGGIIGGAHLNSLTLNSVVIANNQTSSGGTVNTGGGAIQIVGGHLTITNSTIGGTSAPTTFDPTNLVNRDSTTAGNSAGVSGGGINHDPSSGTVMGTVGNLTVTSTTFNNNRSASTAGGGGGVDINNAGFGSGGGGTGTMTFDGCTFSNNQATGAGNTGNGGALLIESLNATIIATSGAASFTSNSATNKGGAIANAGGALTLNGTSPSITFSSNSATNGASSIFANNTTTLIGTNTTVGGSIIVATNGNWTNNAGSAISPTDFSILGGTLTCNNSTMNVTGNFVIGPETTKGGILNANTGTINIQGNLTVNLNNGGSGAVGQFNAGTGTFNFDGGGAGSINGPSSPIFNNLTVNKGGGSTLTLNVNSGISATGNLNVTAGIFNLQGNNMNRAAAGGTLTVSNGATLRIGGTNTLPAIFSTHSIGATSTIEYSGSSQSVATLNSAQSYGNLLTSGSGTKTVAGTIGVVTSLTIGSGTILAGGANTINVAGNWVNNAGVGGFTSTGTVDFNGAGAQSITGATTFNNLTKSGAGTLTLGANITATGNVNLNAGTWNASSFTMNVGGNWNSSTGTFTASTSTVNFNGGAGQSITGTETFNNLTLDNPGTVSLLNDETVTGTLTLTNGVLAVGTNTLTLNGPVSFTSGSISSSSAGTVNYNKSSDVQNVAPGAYGHLTFSNFSKTLPASIITVSGIFTPGSSTGHTITGNTIHFNGGGAQTIPAFNYNNLTSSGAGARTLASSGIIGIAGVFTPGPNVYTITNSTIAFNGAGAQTIPAFNYNNLTVSNTHGANVVSLVNLGTIGVAGAFTPGISTFAITGNTMDFNGAGAQTVPAFPYNNLTISNTHGANPVTLVNGGTIGVAGIFTPGTSTFTITNNTMNFQGAGAQTVPVFNYFHLTFSGNRGGAAITLASGNIGIAGNSSFAATNNTYVTTGNTVIFNGNNNTQTLSGNPTFNNLTINHTGTGNVTAAGSTLSVSGLLQTQAGTFVSSSNLNNVQIDSGTTLQSDGGQMNVTGNWTNNGGTFTPNGNTVNFNGSASQVIGGSTFTTFDNLTIANAGSGVSMGQSANVNGVLTLTNDLTTGANIVTMPASGTSAGTGDVIGNVKRTGFTGGGPALSFGNPFNSISFIVQGTVPTDITVNLVKAAPSGAQGFPTAVLRTYTITPTGGSGYSATVRLHYQSPGDLNGNNPATMNLWRFDSGLNQWRPNPATARDCAAGCTTNLSNFWAERSGVTVLSPWTLNSSTPTAGPATVSGRITTPDGSPLGGAVMHLSGAVSKVTITDSAGNYRFDNVETNNFYTVTPSLANYSFAPASRSFSLTGNMTDAGFTANPDATQTANAIDTIEYFVRQQYLDFLGREPDQGGLEYWSSQFDVCNGDATCIRNKRIDVSAAFFASVEFQQTGSYIYGLYAGTLGRTLNYGEFNADRSQVLGGAGLDQAKTAFAQSFVQRTEFTNRYPQSMSREQFVDAVIQTMQVQSGMFMTSYRDGFLSDYDTGGRALVARHASEASAFVAAEYNKAFVLMEYYGYLRRDIDPGGYAFWLDVLNNGAGSRGMVCAFLTSTEYQHRFSTIVTHSNADCGP